MISRGAQHSGRGDRPWESTRGADEIVAVRSNRNVVDPLGIDFRSEHVGNFAVMLSSFVAGIGSICIPRRSVSR
jgi:branched-subunit amino acid ABC-type transport system permease component